MAKMKLDAIKQIAMNNLPCDGLTEELINQWDVRAIRELMKHFPGKFREFLGKPMVADYDINGEWVVKTVR